MPTVLLYLKIFSLKIEACAICSAITNESEDNATLFYIKTHGMIWRIQIKTLFVRSNRNSTRWRVSRSAGSTRDVNMPACVTSQDREVLSCHYHLKMLFI